MLKQHLQQKLQQRLSPLQIQTIRMLELSTLEMEQRVKQELEENPALEEGVDIAESMESADGESGETAEDGLSDVDLSLGDYLSEDDIPPALAEKRGDDEARTPYSTVSVSDSFYEYLMKQLTYRELTEKQTYIAEYLAGNIEEDGYLRRSLSSVADDITFNEGLDTSGQEVEEVLDVIQDLDPAGVGARSLQECLLLQLERKSGTEIHTLAYTVIKEYFEEFSKRHFDKIETRLGITSETLKEVMAEIVSLNPKPANTWLEDTMAPKETIIPDFIIETGNDEIILSLNHGNIPPLKVSKTYVEMMEDYAANAANQTKERQAALSFIKQKVDGAKWFIDSIRQRQNTMTDIMNEIIRFQHQFFLSGEVKDLRPMTLKNIADRCHYDISTISRVSNNKYCECSFGLFPLKYFFSESMQTESGEDVSSREIKNILAEAIEGEDKQSPYTDEVLCSILKEKGYIIARRTVAKYREQMNYPVARLRKQVK